MVRRFRPWVSTGIHGQSPFLRACWPLAGFTCVLSSCAARPAPAPERGASEVPLEAASSTKPEQAAIPAEGEPEAASAQSEPATSAQGRPKEVDVMPMEEKDPSRALPLPENTTVLHIGDSFAAALGVPLGRLLETEGVRFVLRQETPSYIPGWSRKDKLESLLRKHDPDLVLITLGANELEIVEPEGRIENIRRIVETLSHGERSCVWIATPLWAGEKNGLMGIVGDNVAPCRFLDTNRLIDHMPRVADGIHPTDTARQQWAEVVVGWLRAELHPAGGAPWALREGAAQP